MQTSPRGIGDRLSRPVVARGAALVVLLVIVGGLLARPATAPVPTPGPSNPVAHATPDPTLDPTASPAVWEALSLDPIAVMADLAPERVNRTGVAPTTRFTLQSRNGRPAVELAAGLEAVPAVTFRVLPGETEDTAILEPTRALAEGRTYRLRLTDPDGVLGGSWAFRTQEPLHVLYTLPEDETTDVPLDSGIELTFDQDGSQGVPQRFHIEPAIDGRFEQHDRTWSFIPSERLAPSTAYRVVLDAGVTLEGADQVLQERLSFRFETSPERPDALVVEFASPMSAIRPGGNPSFFVATHAGGDPDKEPEQPLSLPVRIFRLSTLAQAVDAAERLTGPDSWLRASRVGLVPTDDLTEVASVDGSVGHDEHYGVAVLSVPLRLDPGAYLVEAGANGRPAQALLQVTDLAAYGLASDTSTVVWANDLATVLPVAGATVRSADGTKSGVTNAEGLATFPTRPSGPVDPELQWQVSPRVVSIKAADGRWLVAALGGPVAWVEGAYDNLPSISGEPSERYWLLLRTDRDQYRQTDTVHVSGLVRSRDGADPGRVELRLRPASDWDDGDRPSISVVPVTPSRSGAFAVDLPFTSLPFASYRVDLFVDGVRVEERWIDVADIRKPSFQLDVSTDRYAYRVSQAIEVTIRASFFDGSSVPAMELTVDGGDAQAPRRVTTDQAGIATVTVTATRSRDEDYGYWAGQYIRVAPLHPEEGEIAGFADVIVFPSNVWISAEATHTGATVEVAGTTTHVAYRAVDAAEAAGTFGWPYDGAAGAAWAGREVTIRVVRRHEIRRKIGTEYDYLEKKVVDVYEYDIDEIPVGTFTASSGADGTFRLSVPVPVATEGYEVIVTAEDDGGRQAKRTLDVEPVLRPRDATLPSYLISNGYCGNFGQMTVGLDAAAQVTMHDGDGQVADAGRFLFIVGNQGIKDVTVGTSASFSRTLRAADLPGFTIRAVQVTSAGYASADALVSVDLADLEIGVTMTPDRDRYAPGDHVRITVRTLGPGGDPIAADVLVTGVDEKLFAIGAASEYDILPELYRRTSNGFLQSFTSHRVPARALDGGCGDAGGERETFGDVVTSQFVRTGADGRATIEFDLLDDLTSWHLTGVAISDNLRAGRGTVLVPVGLPFFVEGVLAPEYLVGEQPVLRMRAYGDALGTSDPVRFTVTAETLGLGETAVSGRAFEAARVQLPVLTAGTHRVRIAATGPEGLRDVVIREIHVIETRLSTLVTTYDDLVAGFVPTGGDGLTTYVVVDAGRGALISTLSRLASAESARFDRLAAADAARRLLIEEFGFEAEALPSPGFEPAAFQRRGIGVLPYGGPEPELTALAALTVPERLGQSQLREYLQELLDEDPSRETRLLALAGLAGLGDDVLGDLLEVATENLSVRESLWLGLGLVAAGDENGARTVERQLLEEHGQRFGPWVRLAVGDDIDDTVAAGRLLLVLSSRLGEPFAEDVLRYLDDHSTTEFAIALERLAYVQASLERLPRAAGQFAWTLAGERHVEQLEPGGSFQLVLTPAQRSTLSFEPLAGKLEIVTAYSGAAASLPSGGGVGLTRTVTPGGSATEDELVRVTLTVTFGAQATDGCWQISEVVPSGLQPIQRGWAWPDDEEGIVGSGWYRSEGQHLSWCMSTKSDDRTVSYVARVVSPGTYLWEPALIQAADAPELGDATEPTTYTIR